MAIHGSSRGRGHVWLLLLAVLGAALVSVLTLPQWDSPARADEREGPGQQITLVRSADPASQPKLSGAANRGFPEPTVIGGTPVPDGKYPFMAWLRVTFTNGDQAGCGGTLIDPDSVLTAAHCVVHSQHPQTRASNFEIFVGGTDLTKDQWQDRTLAEGWFHDKYKPGVSSAYDVAVLNLNSAVTGIKPIKLNTPDQAGVALETPGRVLTATGWGRTDPNNPNSDPFRMNEVQLRVIPDVTAQQAWAPRPPAFHYFPPLMVATDAQGGKDIAQGDSGGPLFNPGATPTQVGIVSYGGAEPPTTGSKPTAYTDINNAEISQFIVDSAVLEPTAR